MASGRGIINPMTDHTEDQATADAQALLDRLGTERKKLEDKLDSIQKETHDAIVSILMTRTLGPSEVARRAQYDRQHVARIAKKAGVPPLREATVVSRKTSTPPRRTPTPRPAPTSASRPVREHRSSAPAVPMTEQHAAHLAGLARERATPGQLQALQQMTGHVGTSARNFAVVAEATGMGLLTQAEIDTPPDAEATS